MWTVIQQFEKAFFGEIKEEEFSFKKIYIVGSNNLSQLWMIITEVCEWTWRHFFPHSHAPKHKADYCKSRTNLQYEMMSSIHTENTDDYDFWFSYRKNARFI